MIIARSAFLSCVLLSACASGAGDRERQLSEGFARIQIHEARIADANAARESAVECPERCEAHGVLCTESRALCELAHELEDADALARCEHARVQCDDATPSCGC